MGTLAWCKRAGRMRHQGSGGGQVKGDIGVVQEGVKEEYTQAYLVNQTLQLVVRHQGNEGGK